MTYKQLAEKIAQMNEEQLNCDISIYHPECDEFYEIANSVEFAIDDDENSWAGILDEGHPYFTLVP